MKRREFLNASTVTLLSTLLGGTAVTALARKADGATDPATGHGGGETDPVPLPEITAAVDVMVPPDPDLPGDFKGSDYGGDLQVARVLGPAGQAMAAAQLNAFSQKTAGKRFVDGSPDEQIEAIRQWIRERDDLAPLLGQLLSGMVAVGVIGSYEPDDAAQRQEVFTRMGWFLPIDPSGSARIPSEGYPDAGNLPASLKKGVRP
jgi:hypothetical protein